MAKKIKSPIALRQREGKKGISLYLDIYHKGKRRYEYLNLYLSGGKTAAERAEDKKKIDIALAIKRKREEELENGFFCLSGDCDFIRFFEEHCQNDGNYIYPLNLLKFFCGERPIKMSMINDDFLERFYNYIIVGRKESSCFVYMTKVFAIIHKAERLGYRIPKFSWRPPRGKSAIREYLTLDELKVVYERFFDSDNMVMRAFLFSCLTGMRISDIRKLTHAKVRIEGDFYRVFFRQKKTGNQEYLDINEQAYRLLFKKDDPNEKIFNNIDTSSWLNCRLKQCLQDSGITRHISFHCGRHTFAILMLSLDNDIYTVSKLLGHTSVHTTQTYARVLDKKKQEAINKIPKLI